jgi:hypothetical protein
MSAASVSASGQVTAASGAQTTTVAANGFGLRIPAGSGDTPGILQFTNFAANAQWATITSNAVNQLLLNATTTQATGSFSTPGTITVNSGGAVTAIINGAANGVGNIGSSTTYFNTVFAKATSAQYADLAEWYEADADYEPGTVLIFGGSKEVTQAIGIGDVRVAGVVSTNPAHVMNAGIEAKHTAVVALTGRVPTLVVGTVKKGDMMVTAGGGRAQACAEPRMGSVIGKAVQDHPGGQGVIEIVVGRL